MCLNLRTLSLRFCMERTRSLWYGNKLNVGITMHDLPKGFIRAKSLARYRDDIYVDNHCNFGYSC